jgi:hypothetical protein
MSLLSSRPASRTRVETREPQASALTSRQAQRRSHVSLSAQGPQRSRRAELLSQRRTSLTSLTDTVPPGARSAAAERQRHRNGQNKPLQNDRNETYFECNDFQLHRVTPPGQSIVGGGNTTRYQLRTHKVARARGTVSHVLLCIRRRTTIHAQHTTPPPLPVTRNTRRHLPSPTGADKESIHPGS